MCLVSVFLVGVSAPKVIDVGDCKSLNEVGDLLARRRFLCGLLQEEGGQTVEPPVQIVVPLHRVHLLAATD